jgi:predicted metal-dependent hydrolase
VTGEIDVVRHPRARRMRLSVDPASGRARLTLPPRASLKAGMRWAAEHQQWIAAQQARLPQAVPFAPGATFPLRGRPVTIDWRADRPRRVMLDGDRLICGGPVEGLARRIQNWLRREALRLLSEETDELAARIGVVVDRVTVGDPRGRWGSCSSRGAIRYSWRLILAPDPVRRATVAHEVAHRVHMDHSRRFHALVAEVLGDDPAPARAWLRANGAALHWFGRAP